MNLFKSRKLKERELLNDTLLVLEKILLNPLIATDVIKVVNKKLEKLIDEL